MTGQATKVLGVISLHLTYNKLKGKAFTYVLIVCVAAVWGLIIYRVYAAASEDDERSLVTSSSKPQYIKIIDHQDDQVSLNLNYRDPFNVVAGYESDYEKKDAQSVSAVNRAKLIPIKSPVVWPTISYGGYINNPDTKQKTALLTVNGNSVLLKEGQSTYGLKLLKNSVDSLKIQFQGETKIIKIK